MEIKIDKAKRCAGCDLVIPINTQVVRKFEEGVLWFCSLACLKKWESGGT